MTRALVGLRSRMNGLDTQHPRWGWIVAVVVTVLGAIPRFWRLDRPRSLVFDETYYVKGAASLLQAGYELKSYGDTVTGTFTDKVDDRFVAGGATNRIFTSAPDFVVHPPVGKWMIALGELLFGTQSPWGWRFASAVVGTLSIFMMVRIARRLFGSTLLGGTAGLLLAVDGEHLVHSRTGLLDIFVMFWALAAFGCLLLDRDIGRPRMIARPLWGGGLRVRWWRVAAGVCLGLCMGTKWSGLYFLVAFGIMTVLWDVGARRASGRRWWWLVGVLRDGPLAFVQMVPIALVTYLAGWTGWFLSTDAWDRTWGAVHPSAHFGFVPDALRGLWHYHAEMYRFHVGLETPHQYQANPWSWIVMGRPTAFFYESVPDGLHGCTTSAGCSQAITALGNPVVWWGGTLAIAVLLFRWALSRDWRAGAILAGLVGGYLPWFIYQQRTIFSFYAIAFTPFVVLGLTYALALLLGATRDRPQRRFYGALAAGSVIVLATACFAFFYPVLVAEIIPRSSWGDRMWLRSWI